MSPHTQSNPLARVLARLLFDRAVGAVGPSGRIGFRIASGGLGGLTKNLTRDVLLRLHELGGERRLEESGRESSDRRIGDGHFAHLVVDDGSEASTRRRLELSAGSDLVIDQARATSLAGSKAVVLLLAAAPIESLRQRLAPFAGSQENWGGTADFASGALDIGRLAAALIEDVLGPIARRPDPQVTATATERLAQVLRYVKGAYEAADDLVDDAWQAYWYRHVELGLTCLARTESVSAAQLSPDDWIRDWIFPAFGLPNPQAAGSHRYAEAHEVIGISGAIDLYWKTEDKIRQSLAACTSMRRANGGVLLPATHHLANQHPFSRVGLATFDERRGPESQESAFLQFSQLADGEDSGLTRADAFGSLDESEFFEPKLPSKGLIEVEVDGRPAVLEELDSPVAIVDSIRGASRPDVLVESVPVTLRVPLFPKHGVTTADAASTQMRVLFDAGTVTRSRRFRFRPAETAEVVDDFVEMTGVIEYCGRRAGGFEYGASVVELGVELPVGDPLAGAVRPESCGRLILLPPSGAGLLTRKRSSRGAQLVATCATRFDANGDVVAGGTPSIDLERGVTVGVAVWGSKVVSDLTTVAIDGVPVVDASAGHAAAIAPRRICYVDSSFVVGDGIASGEAHVIVVDGESLEIAVTELDMPDPDDQREEVPLVAAILNREVDVPGKLIGNPDVANDVRARLERHFFRWLTTGVSSGLVAGPGTVQNLGFIALPADQSDSDPIEGLEVDDEQGIFRPKLAAADNAQWPFRLREGVSTEFLRSDPVRAFAAAFDECEIPQILRQLGLRGCEGWISKIDLRGPDSPAVDEASVDGLLATYGEMVKAAAEYNDATRMWARYPFSVSIWDDNKCTAVYTSPLHPLRFAWLFSVQRSFRRAHLETQDADDSVNLVRIGGVVAGWNMPMLTPGDRDGAGLAAVPMNTGPESIFCGWGLLLRVTRDDALLTGPRNVGHDPAPGIDASGLSASSVAQAVADFTSYQRYISTVTVDLASESRAPRSREIDAAVARSLVGSTADRDSSWLAARLRHGAVKSGVRVLDSENRVGDPSPDLLSQSDATDGSAVTATWSRYRGQHADEYVNVRILGDASVKVALAGERRQATGSCGTVVLRRFDVAAPHKRGPYALIPSGVQVREVDEGPLPLGQLREFAAALAAAEEFPSSPAPFGALEVNLSSQVGHVRKADWVVLGDAGVPPAAYTELLSAANSAGDISMIWDWHPPFLSAKSISGRGTIDRRPYLVIAALPQSLDERLRHLLATLCAPTAIGDLRRRVLDLIQTLGTRGLGYSRLLKSRNKHESTQKGALGLGVTIHLVDLAMKDREDSFLLSLDASHSFLKALVGQRKEGSLADLLWITVTPECLVLAPIEVKTYGATAPTTGGAFPTAAAAAVQNAMKQVSSSAELFREVKEAWDSARSKNSALLPLYGNALASLVEAAIRTRPTASPNPDRLADALARLAAGSIDIEVSRGAVFYYCPAEEPRYQIYDDGEQPAVIFAAPSFAYTYAYPPDESDSADVVFQTEISNVLTRLCREVRAARVGEGVDSGASSRRPRGGSAPRADYAGEPEPPVLAGPVSADPSGDRADPPPSSTTADQPQSPTDAVPQAAPRSESAETIGGIPASGPTADPTGPLIVGDGIRFPIGAVMNIRPATSAEVWLSNTELASPHMGVVGMTGSGKTQFCSALVYHLRRLSRATQRQPMSGLVLDYKDDYCKKEFIDAVGATVLTPHNLPVDLFHIAGERTKREINRRVGIFIDVVTKVYGIGAVQLELLREAAIHLMTTLGRSPTIAEVEEQYGTKIEKPDQVLSLLRTWTGQEIFTEDPTALRSLGQLLQGNLIVLSLLELRGDVTAQNALVALMLNAYNDHISGLRRDQFSGTEPQLREMNSFILVDEAHNIMKYEFDGLQRLLLEGRAFGVSVILSSQTLGHFAVEKVNYREQIRSWFIHRVANVKDSELLKLGFHPGGVNAQSLSNLKPHQLAYGADSGDLRLVEGVPFFRLLQSVPPEQKAW